MHAKNNRPGVADVPGSVTESEDARPVSFGSVAPTAYVALALGLALFTILIAYQGVREVGGALAAAGPGLLLVAVFHLLPMLANALGWRCLFEPGRRLAVGTMLRARWIGESVNGLLPVLQVGGNVVKAQLVAARGIEAATAGATVVVDVMLMVSTQLVFTVLGVALLATLVGGSALAARALTGAAVMAVLVAGFFAAQQRGMFGGLARRLGGLFGSVPGGTFTLNAAALDVKVRALYRRPRALVAGAVWHLTSWIVGAGEVWLALRFLGHPTDLVHALFLESLGQAVRTAGFLVPGALGVQEGGYIVLGSVLGLAPETALALSLAKRVREIVLGVPGLVVWQTEAVGSLLRPERGGRV
jgi:putative membrane protein